MNMLFPYISTLIAYMVREKLNAKLFLQNSSVMKISNYMIQGPVIMFLICSAFAHVNICTDCFIRVYLLYKYLT